MNTQYYRITAYHPTEDISVIMDSNGRHEKLWQFSAELLQKGFKIIEVSGDEKFIGINITKTEQTDKIVLRATASGKPENITHLLDGIEYNTVKVGGKIYIPDKDKKV
jgi:hypothetical protein